MSHDKRNESPPSRNPVIQERRTMAQTLTLVSTLVLAAIVLWTMRARRRRHDEIRIALRLDSAMPGAHLLWEIVNTSTTPITLSAFVIRPHRLGAGRGESIATIPFAAAITVPPGARAHASMDVDWRLVTAESIAVCDAMGREHHAVSAQLSGVQDQLHELIDRRVYPASASDWLFGAANLTFGAVILGLGFFMLMWVIATG
jgi:hypothetical protein